MAHANKTGFKAANGFEPLSLAGCFEKLAEQQHLLNRVRSVLPSEVARHAAHCVLSGTRLLIYAENANWASQIRFFQEVILNKIRGSGQKNIDKLQVKVMQSKALAEKRRKPRLPKKETLCLLQHYAEQPSSDGDELALAMARLARTLAKRVRQTER